MSIIIGKIYEHCSIALLIGKNKSIIGWSLQSTAIILTPVCILTSLSKLLQMFCYVLANLDVESDHN